MVSDILIGEVTSGLLPDNGARFSAMHLLGTPTGDDINSLMNGGQCGIGASSLSNYDILAVQFLYPANPPVAGTVPVFRYYYHNNINATDPDHFFTTNVNDIEDNGNGNLNTYSFEGVAFFAFATQEPGTVPIYQYYHGPVNDHYYTRTFGNYTGFVYEKIAFYAYPSNINGAVPVYSYYNGPVQDHHYTKNQNETPMSGYVYEGIEFYAH